MTNIHCDFCVLFPIKASTKTHAFREGRHKTDNKRSTQKDSSPDITKGKLIKTRAVSSHCALDVF